MLTTIKKKLSPKAKKNLKRILLRPYAIAKFSHPVWLYLNRKPRQLFQTHPPSLNTVQKRIHSELNSNGIAITHFDELFFEEPDIYRDILSRLEIYVENAEQDPKKFFNLKLWNTRVFHLEKDNGFVRFVLSPLVLDIVNSYMKMWTRFLLSNGYITKVTPESSEEVATQKWHRDRHDNQLVTVLVYLTDVMDEHDGAFWYIPGSHKNKIWWGKLPPLQPEAFGSSSFTNEQVDAVISDEHRKVCTGKKGTIIFADTKGLHKGGHQTNPDRASRIVMLTGYASDNRYSKTKRFSYPDDVESLKATLSDQAKFAVFLEED